ncbi:hypothetical protein GCM10007094_24980 [Pseudovibrio japonicus]|uniref:DUF2490 domain-containing protein n=1 Tax=Pseudovibrio japonicus TaxID=366534 RepID=A0ABQ3EH65_9HYPH|nr:DUF2490 domain-containing protein [Pseudovibrio japonicus]GHB34655.1 hypothetical protein GCM10007094_24980 [Pseudovibrio japonicus]
MLGEDTLLIKVLGALALLLGAFSGVLPARSAEQSFNSWNALYYSHRINDSWEARFRGEVRFDDNLKSYDESVFESWINYYVGEGWHLGPGFKYLNKLTSPDEYDVYQQFFYNHVWGSLEIEQQARFEVRFFNRQSGVTPLFQYQISAEYPIYDRLFLSLSEQARFNVLRANEGIVLGFEQSRLYGGLGFQFNKEATLEFGYMWRFQRAVSGPDRSDHIIRTRFTIRTDARRKANEGNAFPP